MKYSKIDYIKAYNDRIDKAFKDMKIEAKMNKGLPLLMALNDCDTWEYIAERGNFSTTEVAGYYLETYKHKALLFWQENTKHKKQDVTIKEVSKILMEINNN